MATLDDYSQYSKEAINGIYDAQKTQKLNALESAYNQNLSTAEAARDKIGGAYQTQQNNLANTYERTRKNSNEMAAANGINTGAGTQAQLMQRSEYQRDSANIGKAEANAMNDAERGITDLKTQYQNAVVQANAENDYQRSTALLQQYKDEYNKGLDQAKTLAAYGDFSGYANIYGQAQADNMKKAWVASNPDLAYNTGSVSAEEYRNITGVYPKGYVPAYSGGGGGGGWYDNYTKDSGNKDYTVTKQDVTAAFNSGYDYNQISNWIGGSSNSDKGAMRNYAEGFLT